MTDAHFDRYTTSLRDWLFLQAANAQLLFGNLSDSSLNRLLEVDPDSEKFMKVVSETPGWRQFMALYAYAYEGREQDQPPLRSEFYDQFLDTSLNLLRLPSPVLDVVHLAQARQVLDGGDRELQSGDDEDEIPVGYLTVSEVAALAAIDTRSVRNAMSPKLPDPLVGQPYGKRVFIAVGEAQRWLSGRKGFKPTQRAAGYLSPPPSLVITGRLAVRLQRGAEQAGISVDAYLEKALTKGDLS